MNYQLSSLVIYPPTKCHARVTVFSSREDERTQKVLEHFLGLDKLDLNCVYQPLEELGRRSIGRDLAAKKTKADIVWFTDADFLFRDGCLDSLATKQWRDGTAAVIPKKFRVSRSEQFGMKAIKRVDRPRVLDIKEDEFGNSICTRMLGALQIVRGPEVKSWGYCRGHRYHQLPTDGTFERCRSDTEFRRFWGTRGDVQRIAIPNLYRILHPHPPRR